MKFEESNVHKLCSKLAEDHVHDKAMDFLVSNNMLEVSSVEDILFTVGDDDSQVYKPVWQKLYNDVYDYFYKKCKENL